MLPGNAKCSMTYRYMTLLADTKHIFIERLIYLWDIEFCIWLRPRAVHIMRVLRARRNYKLSSREQLSGHWPQTARQLYHLVVAVAIIVDYA